MVTRILFLFLFLSFAAFLPSGSLAVTPKSEAVPHLVRLLLRADAAAKLHPAFAAKRATCFDIQRISLDSTDNLSQFLGLSARIHPSRLRPFLPEHSLVFEDVREHLNPSLFAPKISLQSVRVGENALLRSSEERLSRWFTLQFSDNISPEQVARWCSTSASVEFAEPVFARMLCDSMRYTTNDPLSDSQYALKMMHVLGAWKIVRCDSAIPNNDTMVLADVDEGADLYHEDLQLAVWRNPGETGPAVTGGERDTNHIDDDSDGYIDDWEGWDFAGYFGDGLQHNSPYSMREHGSHTAGIMGAVGNNGVGIAGVAFGSKIMVLKASSSFDNFIVAGDEAIAYAADHKAKVVNCSWGGYNRSISEQDIIDYAYAKGSIVVVSGGNLGNRNSKLTEFYPASCRHAVSVTSVNDARVLQDYPTYNTHVAFAAPGERILSTVHKDGSNPTGYLEDYGTSMAAPNASGALGLVWQHFPSYTNRQTTERLRVTCDTISGSHPGFRGKGLINVYRAVTDPHSYSLRLDSASVARHSGKGVLRAGDLADVQLNFTNVLDPLSHAKVRLEFLNDMGDSLQSGYVTASKTAFDLGAMGTLASSPVQNFAIQTDSKVPALTKVFCRLWISDSSVGYVGDYDYFDFTINPGYETLDANNVTVSFDDKGCIGFRDQQYDVQGDGLVWTKAPGSILLDGRSVLLDGGLVVASDALHSANGFGGLGFDPERHLDFASLAPIVRTETTPYGPGQMLEIHFSDTSAPIAGHVGVRVAETAYELKAAAAANTFITHYAFLPGTVPARFDAGLFMDWDIGQTGLQDTAYFNAVDSIFYIFRKDPSYPYVGMKLVHPGIGVTATHYALRLDTDDGGITFTDPLHFTSTYEHGADTATDSITWALFQSNKRSAGAGDVAVLFGDKDLSLASGSSEMTMILGFGVSQADVRLSLINTQAIMEGRSEVASREKLTQPELEVWPDPVTNGTRIEVLGSAAETTLDVSLWDAIGRCVRPEQSLENGGREDLSWLPAGIYTVQVVVRDRSSAQEGKRLFRTIVKE